MTYYEYFTEMLLLAGMGLMFDQALKLRSTIVILRCSASQLWLLVLAPSPSSMKSWLHRK